MKSHEQPSTYIALRGVASQKTIAFVEGRLKSTRLHGVSFLSGTPVNFYETLYCHTPEDTLRNVGTCYRSISVLHNASTLTRGYTLAPSRRNVSKFPNDAVTSQRIESSSETSANFHQTTWRHIRGDSSLRFTGVCIFRRKRRNLNLENHKL